MDSIKFHIPTDLLQLNMPDIPTDWVSLGIMAAVAAYIVGYAIIRQEARGTTSDDGQIFSYSFLWIFSPAWVPFALVLLVIYGLGKLLTRK